MRKEESLEMLGSTLYYVNSARTKLQSGLPRFGTQNMMVYDALCALEGAALNLESLIAAEQDQSAVDGCPIQRP